MSEARKSPWWIVSPLAGGSIHAIGSGLFHMLLPLRLVEGGYGADAVGLVVAAEGAGFLLGCIGSKRLINSVGEVRAYSAFSAVAAVLLLAFGWNPGLVVMMAILVVVGFANAGQFVVIESWLNTCVENDNRGRVFTLYVLLMGLFYGLGQLMGRSIDPSGDKMLMLSAGFYAFAIVPVSAIKVADANLHAPVGLHLLRAFKTSPLGTFATLLTGLISSTFGSVGPLFGLHLGFPQDKIVILMAAVQFGGLFLQFPLGYLSDRLDRRKMMFWLALCLAAVCMAFLAITSNTPLWLLIVMFGVFGGMSEIFYSLGVAHANDRAKPEDFVSLSSNLLLVWALGSMIGPPIVTFGVERAGAYVFFWYAIGLSLLFAAFALWRSLILPRIRAREEFVAYPHVSPAVYEWSPHTETPKE